MANSLETKIESAFLQSGNGNGSVQKIQILTKDVVCCLDKNVQERWGWTLIARIGKVPKGLVLLPCVNVPKTNNV